MMNLGLPIGSTFSGVGGLELGLEQAGLGRTIWHCEPDPFCQAVLAKHWPGLPCYRDICEVRRGEVNPVDILCGGFPCQPFSSSGKQKGKIDDRYLWPELGDAIEALQPAIVVLENVVAIRKLALADVLRDLAALGYDAEWTELAPGEPDAPIEPCSNSKTSSSADDT